MLQFHLTPRLKKSYDNLIASQTWRYAQRPVPNFTALGVSALSFAGAAVEKDYPGAIAFAFGGLLGAKAGAMAFYSIRDAFMEASEQFSLISESALARRLWEEYSAFKCTLVGGVFGILVAGIALVAAREFEPEYPQQTSVNQIVPGQPKIPSHPSVRQGPGLNP